MSSFQNNFASERAQRRNQKQKPDASPHSCFSVDVLERRVLFDLTVNAIGVFTGANGEAPECTPIFDSSGNLFGTAGGGLNGDGDVWEVAKGSTTVTDVADFTGANPSGPQGALAFDSQGNLYGATSSGGVYGFGSVWELPSGGHAISDLADFNDTGSESFNPTGGVIIDSEGNLYGTLSFGEGSSTGGIFELVKGTGTLSELAEFNGTDGQSPLGPLVMDSQGNLYGTAEQGGANGDGDIFELPKGSGFITDIADFNLNNGAGPECGLVIDGSGNLYGSAPAGGDLSVEAEGDGDVFELPEGSHTIVDLANFSTPDDGNTYPDGFGPAGGVLLDASGNLFGLCDDGGTPGDSVSGAAGTIYEVPKNSDTIVLLASFNGSDGYGPRDDLIADNAGNIYGTTADGGGTASDGVVFEVPGAITPSAAFATLNNGILTVEGTSNADSISVADTNGTVVATLNGQVYSTQSDVVGISIAGGAGNDSINLAGVPIDATVGGAGGADSITGGAGDDSLKGGQGNDTIGGAGGSDTIVGGAGDDSLKGGAGDDSILGGPGNDTLHGGAGDDTLGGGIGNDSVNGNDGNDSLFAGSGSSQLLAGPGNDTITGSIVSGYGADTITAGGGQDSIECGAADSILGSSSSDTIVLV